MPLAIEAQIADLLLSHVNAFCAAESPTLAVSMPDVPFTPTEGEPYLDVALLPNTTLNFAIADTGSSRYRGLLQIAVMWPSGQGGLLAALDLAGRVAAHFAKGTRLADTIAVQSTSKPSIAPPMAEPGRLRIPVTVSYQCFAKPELETAYGDIYAATLGSAQMEDLMTVALRISRDSLTLPPGLVTKARLEATLSISKVFIGQAAPSGNPYDASALYPVTFNGGDLGILQDTGQWALSDEVAFAWDKSSDLIVSMYWTPFLTTAYSMAVTGSTAYFLPGSDEAGDAVKSPGYNSFAQTAYFVSRIKMDGF